MMKMPMFEYRTRWGIRGEWTAEIWVISDTVKEA
jgi:hypothetical protein